MADLKGFDTNILVYAFNADEKEKHKKALGLLEDRPLVDEGDQGQDLSGAPADDQPDAGLRVAAAQRAQEGNKFFVMSSWLFCRFTMCASHFTPPVEFISKVNVLSYDKQKTPKANRWN